MTRKKLKIMQMSWEKFSHPEVNCRHDAFCVRFGPGEPGSHQEAGSSTFPPRAMVPHRSQDTGHLDTWTPGHLDTRTPVTGRLW